MSCLSVMVCEGARHTQSDAIICVGDPWRPYKSTRAHNQGRYIFATIRYLERTSLRQNPEARKN
jgi:hypothetical protein